MIFDTHAHYDDEQFDADREELLSGMKAGGVGMIVDAAAAVASWDKILELTEKYPFLYGSVGVHPDEVGDLNEELNKVKRFWNELIGKLQVSSPLESTNILLNGWAIYQTLSCRLWGRTRFLSIRRSIPGLEISFKILLQLNM